MAGDGASNRRMRQFTLWAMAGVSAFFGLGLGITKSRPSPYAGAVPIDPALAWPVGGFLIGLGILFAIWAFFVGRGGKPGEGEGEG